MFQAISTVFNAQSGTRLFKVDLFVWWIQTRFVDNAGWQRYCQRFQTIEAQTTPKFLKFGFVGNLLRREVFLFSIRSSRCKKSRIHNTKMLSNISKIRISCPKVRIPWFHVRSVVQDAMVVTERALYPSQNTLAF